MPFLAPLVGVLATLGGATAATATTGSIIAGSVLAGTTALAVGETIHAATSHPKAIPDVPSAATAAANTQTAADAAAAEVKARARRAGSGRQSTILTSPLGVTGSSSVSPVPKTLLGQ